MRTIWFISDTHFAHENILRFRDEADAPIRPGFANVEDMDETMIAAWNGLVKAEDVVYHLGDVAFGDRVKVLDRIMPRLKGRKRLILGNHDTADVTVYRRHFQKVMSWRHFGEDICGKGLSFVACHYPLHPSSFWRPSPGDGDPSARACVHGHIHQKTIPDSLYINVCVERTGYQPCPLEGILDTIRNAFPERTAA